MRLSRSPLVLGRVSPETVSYPVAPDSGRLAVDTLVVAQVSRRFSTPPVERSVGDHYYRSKRRQLPWPDGPA